MKKRTFVIVMAVALTAMTMMPTAVRAADASLDAAVLSAYVWRGQVLNDEMVLQPGLTASSENGLSFNAWGNFDLTDKFDNKNKFTEIDLTASYALPLEGPVGVDIGVIEYTFPNSDLLSTREVYVSAGADVVLAPTLTWYYDFGEVDSFYANFALSHSFDVMEGLSLDLGSSVGFGGGKYNETYFGAEEKAKFNDMNFSGGLSYAITEEISAGATIMYTFLLDSEIRDAAEATFEHKDRVYGGVTLGYAF